MPHIKNKNKRTNRMWFIPLGVLILALLLMTFMRGQNIAPFNPKGLIAADESRLILVTIAILFSVAIPAVLLLFFTAWRFRESNSGAVYVPEQRQNAAVVVLMWMIPTMFMLLLAFILWDATHRLVPQDPIASNTKPLHIQVIAQRWKWLFIYPDQNIATVNYVQFPVNTPVEFDLTADEAPMSAFWIPNLGGQLYAMTGMVNKLNLMADTPGAYPGSSPEINGSGFAGMQFTARASTNYEFNKWVQATQNSSSTLDQASYSKLLKPSEYNPPKFYASADRGLYGKVLMKYMPPMDSKVGATEQANNL